MAVAVQERLRSDIEILQGETFKTVAELALHGLAKRRAGERLISYYAFEGEPRLQHPSLHTEVAGIHFENPITVGAGWDKKGRAIRGLYNLGFSGVEVGTVPLFGQPGNPKPRLWTIDKEHSVGLNRLGFNSPGSEVIERNLQTQLPLPCPIGINVGKNKLMPDEMSPWAHAEVVRRLYSYANYFVFNPSSPNTPGLRNLQQRIPLHAHIQAMQEAMDEKGARKPLFVKIAPDLTLSEIDQVVAVAIETGIAGLITVNTTIDKVMKAKYGPRWAEEAGGLSGNDWEYRMMSSVIIRYIYELYERAGDALEIIGVGGVHDLEGTIEKMLAGASLIQVVTGIRSTRGRVAAQINTQLVEWMERHKVANVKELIGGGTTRGSRYPSTSKSEKSHFLKIVGEVQQRNEGNTQ